MKNIFIIAFCIVAAICGTTNAKSLAFTGTATVKSHNDNPWGLVYQDAITKNEMGKANIRPKTYYCAKVCGHSCKKN